jgi:hypothetical protein
MSNFAWSYSKLKDFESCPRKFHETSILKKWKEGKSEMQNEGDRVHKALADAISKGTDLPLEMGLYQKWVDEIVRTPGQISVECKWAITKEFEPTAWFSHVVWLRAVADVVKVSEDLGFTADWKTGKSANVDPMQNQIVALMMFAQLPKLRAIKTRFVWLNDDTKIDDMYLRGDVPEMWAELLPRVEKLKKACEINQFPPTPNRFCRSWCGVKTCEFHGR